MFRTFGCKLNFAETSTVARLFAETASVADIFVSRGHRVADDGEEPDLIVVNSCSVTAEADRKCRSAIRGWHRRFPGAAIVVTG